MITTPLEMRAKTFDLTTHAWLLAAIGVVYEYGLADQLAQPRAPAELTSTLPATRVIALLEVLAAAGVVVTGDGRYWLADGAMPFLQQPMRTALLGDIRSHLMQPLAFLNAPAQPAWTHTDPRLLQAQGDASLAMPMMFKQLVVPALAGLAERMEQPGTRFLDVGVGVGSIAIGMCRAFAKISVVGIDPSEVPLALARANVAAAGVTDRVELRQIGLEALHDDAGFDAAWVPGFFVPPAKADAGLARLHTAMRPNGWVVLGTVVVVGGEPRVRATGMLLSDLWGGPPWQASDGEAALARAGFTNVHAVPGPAWAPKLVVGQRV